MFMIKEKIKVNGMSCSHCIKTVEEALDFLPIETCEVKIGNLYVEYNEEEITKKEIISAIENCGYQIINNDN